MKKIILLILSMFITSVCFSGTLGTVKAKTKGFFDGNSGNQTVVNVQKEDPPEEFIRTEEKGYKESEITLFGEFAPYIFPSGSTNRQFSQDTFSIGALWKINEHFHLIGKWMNYEVNAPDGDEKYKAIHYMYGLGWRMTTLSDQQVQINIGSSVSEVEWIDGGDYELPVWGEFKYLWCSDNTAFGVVATVLDMPKKEADNQNFKNAGFMTVGLTFEVGLPSMPIQ